MGLYLCIFDEDDEIEGVEIGPYEDWSNFRNAVVTLVEGGVRGSKCPILTMHADSDGEWSPKECEKLESELSVVSDIFGKAPPRRFPSKWQEEVARSSGIAPKNLAESFLDVDGEFLLARLIDLVKIAQRTGRSIIFQ